MFLPRSVAQGRPGPLRRRQLLLPLAPFFYPLGLVG